MNDKHSKKHWTEGYSDGPALDSFPTSAAPWPLVPLTGYYNVNGRRVWLEKGEPFPSGTFTTGAQPKGLSITKEWLAEKIAKSDEFDASAGWPMEVQPDGAVTAVDPADMPKGAVLPQLDWDLMCEAFSRVIEAHASKSSPFHNPVNADAMLALRELRHALPAIKAATQAPAPAQSRFGPRMAELLAYISERHPALRAELETMTIDKARVRLNEVTGLDVKSDEQREVAASRFLEALRKQDQKEPDVDCYSFRWNPLSPEGKGFFVCQIEDDAETIRRDWSAPLEAGNGRIVGLKVVWEGR